MRNLKSFKLFESPDYISELDLSISNGIPFAIKDGKVFFGDLGQYHADCGLLKKYGFEYPGRIWVNEKCISFWVYPPLDEFKNIIKQIEKKLDIKIFNNNWNIEIYRLPEGIAGIDVKATDNYYFDISYQNTGRFELIPIDEYVGSNDVPEKERAVHLLSWAEKQALKRKGWGKGFGSDLTAWDGKNPLYWRQAKYQESVKYKK